MKERKKHKQTCLCRGTLRNVTVKFSALLLAVLSVLTYSSCGGTTVPENTTGISEELTQSGDTAGVNDDIGEAKYYNTIFNSDTTHILQCASPYHATNQNTPITKKMVEAAVTEALDAGADCYVITPGHCWVPWWPSQYLAEHSNWFFNELGGKNATNQFWNYIHVKGNDLIQQQIDVCRERNTGVFINYRLNDAHMINKTTKDTADIAFSAEIFVEHPEYRIGAMSDGTWEQVLDFRFPEVREHKLKLIRELIENYEIDGFELDFCRRFALFNTDKTTEKERLRIMTDFVKEVRSMLDEATAKDGRYRHLSVRIPIYDDIYGKLGIDLEEFEKAGVTIFNFTSSYFMDQNFDLAALKSNIKDAYVYCELNFTTAVAYDEEGLRIHRRATEEQYYTTALTAYNQGADGISFFNFQYYRGDRQGKGDEPLTEPPWEVIENVKDLAGLKSRSQYYYFGQTWKDPITESWKLPKNMIRNIRSDFSMYLVSPEGGWSTDGVFRLQSLSSLEGRVFSVTVNGTVLESTEYTGEAYENEYTQMIGSAENYACFTVPKELLKEGKNTIYVTLVSGASTELCFVDLTVR